MHSEIMICVTEQCNGDVVESYRDLQRFHSNHKLISLETFKSKFDSKVDSDTHKFYQEAFNTL